MPAVNQFCGFQTFVTAAPIQSSTDGAAWATLAATPTRLTSINVGARVFATDLDLSPNSLSSIGGGGVITEILSPNSRWWDVGACNNNSRLVAIATTPAPIEDGNTAVVVDCTTAYSDNGGATWAAGTMLTPIGNAAASSGNIILAGRRDTVGILRTTDGITWTAPTLPTALAAEFVFTLFWTGARFIAFGSGGASANSIDGNTWTAGVFPASSFGATNIATRIFQVTAPFAGFTKYLVLPGGAPGLSTDDGLTWYPYSSFGLPAFPTGTRQIAMRPPRAGAARRYVMVGSGASWHSPDCLNWTSGGATSIDAVRWIGEIGNGSDVVLASVRNTAGIFPTGRLIGQLPALYAVPAPTPPTYWSRKVGSRERA